MFSFVPNVQNDRAIILLDDNDQRESCRARARGDLYGSENDPGPQMISKLDRKWSPMGTANDPD